MLRTEVTSAISTGPEGVGGHGSPVLWSLRDRVCALIRIVDFPKRISIISLESFFATFPYAMALSSREKYGKRLTDNNI